MATLTVGTGKQFATIAAAVSATQDGDTVLVDAGTYANDFFTVSHKITMQSVGGRAIDVATVQPSNGKAIATVDNDLTISGFGFTGAAVGDGNGAGLRYEAGNLVVNNDLFWNNQNGILGNQVITGTMLVENSEFGFNGAGDGRTHNIYVGEMASFTAENNYFHDANEGHEIKSRAYNNTIINNRIFDNNAQTSYSIDLPDGGNDLVQGNIIEKGANDPNHTTIHFGGEGGPYPGSTLSITGNTIIDDNANGLEVYNQSGLSTVSLTNNNLYAYNNPNVGAVTSSGNTILTTRPTLDLSTQLPAIPPPPPPPVTTPVPASAHLQSWGTAGAVTASGHILTVGAGGQFTSLGAALGAAHDGDTIEVAAGTYYDDYSTVNNKVIIEGVGGIARFVQTVQGDALRAIMVVNTDATIMNVELSGGRGGGGREGGINVMGGNVTIDNSIIDNNDIGIQTAADPSIHLSVFNSEIGPNGSDAKGTNNITIGAIGSLTMQNDYIHGANDGHELATYAYYNDIENNRIIDGAGIMASFSIDLGMGGNDVVKNNMIEKGAAAANGVLIHVGGDGPTYDNSNVQISGNTLISDLNNPNHPYSWFIIDDPNAVTPPPITATNNTFVGGVAGSLWLSGVATSSGNVAGTHPVLDTSAPWSAAAAPALFAPVAGADTLRLGLTDVIAPMSAQFNVSVDGVLVGGGTVLAHGATATPQIFAFKGSWGAGPHVITVTGTNLTGQSGLTASSLTVASVSLDSVNAAPGALVAGWTSTSYSTTLNLPSLSTPVGAGVNFFGDGVQVQFQRSTAGALQVSELGSGGVILGTQALTSAGAPLLIDNASSVIGAGEDFYGTTGHTAFLRLQNGAVQIDEFASNGALTAAHSMTNQGAVLPIDAATTVIGGGQDFFRNGGHTAFFRNGAGVLYAWSTDGNGAINAWQNLGVQGPALTVAAGATVIGGGADFFGTNGRAAFLRLQSGAVQIDEFDTTGVLTASHTMTSQFAAVPVDTATTVIGGGQDFFGNGGHTAFFRNAAGILYAWETDGNGAINAWQNLGIQSPAVTLDTATTVIGAGSDFFGTAGRAVYLRTQSGAVQVDEFDSNGALTTGHTLTMQGAAVPIDTTTTIIGGGQDFFGNGGHTAFLRNGAGILSAWETDGNGAISGWQSLGVQGGVAIDAATTVVGAGQDYFGTAGRAVFLRTQPGGLQVDEFNANGVLTGSQALTLGGATIDTATTVVGAGEDYLATGGRDAFIRAANGALSLWEFDRTGAIDARQAFTLNGAALTVDSALKVTGLAGDPLKIGGHGIYVQEGAGPTHVWEFSAAGARIGVL